MGATEIILEAVESAKREAKSAESLYDIRAETIERRASQTIDLFGGTATSQVVEIASMAKEACDDLYVAYQTQVKILDEICRPLLNEQPSVRAVKEVLEMIRWLNSESKIENNFSGSLNGSSLGQMYSSKYMPSIENKMIEQLWESKYNGMPGAAEENKAYQQRKTEERKAQREAEMRERQRIREEERREREEAVQREKLRKKQAKEHFLQNKEVLINKWKETRKLQGLVSGSYYAKAVVKEDGTVAAKTNFFATDQGVGDVSAFRNIRSVVCTSDGIVGLRNNGTCISTRVSKYCDAHLWEANQWQHVQEIAAGDHHVVGLRSDGTCVATSIKWNVGYGYDGQSDVAGWRDVTAIACGYYFTIGLKKDGSIYYAGRGASGAEGWKNIVMIGAQGDVAFGITATGELKVAGKVRTDTIDHAENIIQITAFGGIAYALLLDGTVVGGRDKGYEEHAQKIASGVVAINSSGNSGLIMLKGDGSITTHGRISGSDMPSEKPFTSIESYRERIAREEALKKAQEEERRRLQAQQASYREQKRCQYCGGEFKKVLIFSKCSKCGKMKDY